MVSEQRKLIFLSCVPHRFISLKIGIQSDSPPHYMFIAVHVFALSAVSEYNKAAVSLGLSGGSPMQCHVS
jgi:hypothetical protein